MQVPAEPANPLADLIDDAVYQQLDALDLLNEKGIRDYQMRNRFRSMRQADVPAALAIEELREEYPYLQYDTIRKIVYGLRRRAAAA